MTDRKFTFRLRKTVPGIARELLRCFEDKRRWTRDFMARDAAGNKVETDCHTAVCWCMSGAATEIVGPWLFPSSHTRFDRFRAAFEDVAGCELERFNDTRGLPAVRRVLRRLARGKR